MKYLTVVFVTGVLMLGVACAHVASTQTTFVHSGDYTLLKVRRHMDEILNGPDSDEDQELVLQLHDYKIGERLPIPSAKATATFEVDRFGPASHGDEFVGYVIVKEEGPKKVKMYLKLDIKAQTNDGSYSQQAKYHGDFIFFKVDQPDF